MKLSVMKMWAFVALGTVYIAGILGCLVLTDDMDAVAMVAFLGGVVLGGMAFGVGVIDGGED